MNRFLLSIALTLFAIFSGKAQSVAPVFNYDEAKSGNYTLPDPLVSNNGKPVRTRNDWKKRRAELLQLSCA